ncbi:MAG: YggS family pyridoxal phosphate-dependent enzyme [Pseudanabaenaceae cyanobacterium]
MVDVNTIQTRCANLLGTLPPHVTLIAVTKYATPEMMRAAYAGGVRHFGENRVQSAKEKRPALADLTDVTWHMIGHLQTNKTRLALELFDWIHSVDRLALAQQLNQLLPESPHQPHLCLQVKLAPDPQKSGWTVEQLHQDLPQLTQLEHLDIRGLMTILPLGTTGTPALELFKATASLAQHLRATFPQLQELSMGMSQDYKEAIAAGATMIRIGSNLFL